MNLKPKTASGLLLSIAISASHVGCAPPAASLPTAAAGVVDKQGDAAGKRYVLPATPETVQWGWLDPNEPPKLAIDSGDTVAVETLMHAKDALRQEKTI